MSTLETTPLVAVRPSSDVRRGRPARPQAETVLFLGLLVLYLAVGFWLVLAEHSIMEDALSRVANAGYVLYSREPKLANVGFVWTPLPSLLYLPFLPLGSLWPPLVQQGLLANIVSAVAMAAAARVLCGLLGDLGVPRRVRIAVALVVGLQPMIIWFGANGMTEALLIVLVLLACRRLVRWTTDGTDDPRHLMAAGGFLAVGYLARYEVLASGLAAVVAVGVLSWRRTAGSRTRRRDAAVADALLVGGPIAVTFVLWAVASWVIVGHPFDQFSSVYGNSALVDAGGAKTPVDPALPVLQWLILAPTLPIALTLAGIRAVRTRDTTILVPAALLGAVLAFELVVYFAGSLFGFLRYQIIVIPLLAVLVGYLCRPPAEVADIPRRRVSPLRGLARPLLGTGSGRRSILAVSAAVVLLAPGLVTSGSVFMTDPRYASQEWGHVRPALQAAVGDPAATVGSSNGAFDVDRRIAAYLDARRLPPGSVVIDSGPGFAVLAATTNLSQFVITSDRDFAGAVIDPVGHHVQYLLLNRGRSQFDDVAATWPDLASGTPVRATWAEVDTIFPSGGQPGAHEWTLWRVRPRE